MIDSTKVGVVTAELMDYLAESYGDDEVGVGTVMVLVEVTGTDEDGDDWTAIQSRCSDPRAWVQNGMLHAGLRS
jgi:hypothetical protein